MILNLLKRHLAVALPFVGSAILLFSCEAKKSVSPDTTNLENLMTEYSENLSMQMSENGQKSYHFTTPLMEGYALAREPYKEFRKGVKIITYEGDTVKMESATLTANYAIFYETRKLWEAKGDVVVIQTGGRRLYTSQLFWNQATHRIYSNVDSRVVDGDEIYDCEGFESDEEMTDWHYRKLKGVTYFTEPEQKADSLKTAEVGASAEKATPAVEKTAESPAQKQPVKAKPKRSATSSAKSASATTSRPKSSTQRTTSSRPARPNADANRTSSEERNKSVKITDDNAMTLQKDASLDPAR